MYNIESGIAVPAKKSANTHPRSDRIYPFAEMKPGDSFFVENPKSEGSIRVQCSKQSDDCRKFITRKEKEGLRVHCISA